MSLRDRLKRIEKAAGAEQALYVCTACGERWRTPSSTLLDFHIHDYHRKKAARHGEGEPEPEGYLRILDSHIEHLGEVGEIHDLSGGISVVPPPLFASRGIL